MKPVGSARAETPRR